MNCLLCRCFVFFFYFTFFLYCANAIVYVLLIFFAVVVVSITRLLNKACFCCKSFIVFDSVWEILYALTSLHLYFSGGYCYCTCLLFFSLLLSLYCIYIFCSCFCVFASRLHSLALFSFIHTNQFHSLHVSFPPYIWILFSSSCCCFCCTYLFTRKRIKWYDCYC